MGEEGAYVRSAYLGCARRCTTQRKRCGNTRAEEKQERKDKKENKQKITPETCEKVSGVNLFITKRQAGI